MRPALALILVVPVVIGPRLARADAEPSCETVTTVRCTGSAAPLALPPPLEPPPVIQPAAPPPAPPRALPPQQDDAEVPRAFPPAPPCCAEPTPSPPIGDAVERLPGGWRLVHWNGGVMLERKKRTGIGGIWGPGLALWMLSYLGTSVSGAMNERPWAAAPFLGGFVAGGIDLADGNMSSGIGYSIGSAMQLSGFVMFLVGLSVGEKIERMPVAISPVSYRDGGGVSLQGRF